MTPPAVVVAEDSLVIRAVLVEQLQSHGFGVIEAGDGEEALAAGRREQPDVMLLDVEMPHLDGHGVLARIKADPRLVDIPVVCVTSRVTTEDVVDGLRLGAHDYLRKPFEPSELLARGHAAGDEILRVVATRLGEVARPGDVPGRWGGEEFLVVLPATGPTEDGWECLVRRPTPACTPRGGRPRPSGGRPAGRVANLHTGRPRCGKIPMTGSGPTTHRETGIRLADQQVIGKVGRVTGTIGPERVGEVMIAIRGGSEAFNAYAADTTDTISTGTRVVVIEYFPPRTVVVSPM